MGAHFAGDGTQGRSLGTGAALPLDVVAEMQAEPSAILEVFETQLRSRCGPLADGVPVAFENLHGIGRIEVVRTPDAEAAQEVGERRADSIDPDQVGEFEGASEPFAVQIMFNSESNQHWKIDNVTIKGLVDGGVDP